MGEVFVLVLKQSDQFDHRGLVDSTLVVVGDLYVTYKTNSDGDGLLRDDGSSFS